MAYAMSFMVCAMLHIGRLFMNIGENLAQLRKDKQISVYKLSQLSDVSINYIRRVEKGESIPSIEILTALLSPLGIRLSEFFKEGADILYPSPYEAELVRLSRQLNEEQAAALLNLAKLLAQK